jgi:hypothetical protein
VKAAGAIAGDHKVAIDGQTWRDHLYVGLVSAWIAGANVAVADLGRRRIGWPVLALGALFGLVVVLVWQGVARSFGDALLATYVYSGALGAIVGFRLAREGPRRRLRRAVAALAGAACGAADWYVALWLLDRMSRWGLSGPDFAAADELAFWLPLAAVEALAFAWASRRARAPEAAAALSA